MLRRQQRAVAQGLPTKACWLAACARCSANRDAGDMLPPHAQRVLRPCTAGGQTCQPGPVAPGPCSPFRHAGLQANRHTSTPTRLVDALVPAVHLCLQPRGAQVHAAAHDALRRQLGKVPGDDGALVAHLWGGQREEKDAGSPIPGGQRGCRRRRRRMHTQRQAGSHGPRLPMLST